MTRMIRNTEEDDFHAAEAKEARLAQASLQNRYPGISFEVEHSACEAAARLEGRTNIRPHIAPIIGGWGAWLIAYSPILEGYSQRFQMHGSEDYPERAFKSSTDAKNACTEHEPALRAELAKFTIKGRK